MQRILTFIGNYFFFAWWTLRGAGRYFLLNLRSWTTVARNYIFLIFVFLLLAPWLSGQVGISVFADLVSIIGFLQLIQDKIQVETQQEELRKKIHHEATSEVAEIVEFFADIGIEKPVELAADTIGAVISGVRDYEYFDDQRYKYVLQLLDRLLSIQDINDKLKFYLRYLVFSELKTKYRQKYIDENIRVRDFERRGSNEEALLKHIAYRSEKGKICLDASFETMNFKLDKYAAMEFGDKIQPSKIEKIYSDKEKAEKFKKILTEGIVKGLISERGLESITRNQNKLLVVIKYGEGTSVKGWPKAQAAPFAKVLRRNKFDKPYYQDDFAFIRDLTANPIEEDIDGYTNRLLKELESDYEIIKKNPRYRNIEVVQEGPHYEILAFIADKQSFVWKLSRQRSFNSFINNLLLNEMLESGFNKDFVRANFFKIRKVVENISWFSLIKNEKLRAYIEQYENKIKKELASHKIKVDTLFDLGSLNSEKTIILEDAIYSVVKKRNISERKRRTSEKQKQSVVRKQVSYLLEDARQFVGIIRELER